MGVELSLLLHDPPADVVRTARAVHEGTLRDRIAPVGGMPLSPPYPEASLAAISHPHEDTSSTPNDLLPPRHSSATTESLADEDGNAPLGASKISKIEKWLSTLVQKQDKNVCRCSCMFSQPPVPRRPPRRAPQRDASGDSTMTLSLLVQR